MLDIIDVSMACGGQAAFLAGAGVKTIIRYYSRDTGIPQKRLSRSEASAFAAAGLRIGIVHEARHGDRLTSFSEPLGEADAAYAREYATKVIGQPAASAIYFGADVDPNSNQIRDLILPYFKGVAAAFGAANGQSVYQVGVYGSGATCAAVLDAGLATFTWLAQSRGWAGYKAFLQSNRWSLLQAAATKVGEIDCDPNKANGNFGDFFLTQSIAPAAVASGGMQTVNARDGLRLRAGPGTEFDDLQVLPFGTKVHIVKTVGDWALVDLAGDSALDGFVNSHFLSA